MFFLIVNEFKDEGHNKYMIELKSMKVIQITKTLGMEKHAHLNLLRANVKQNSVELLAYLEKDN